MKLDVRCKLRLTYTAINAFLKFLQREGGVLSLHTDYLRWQFNYSPAFPGHALDMSPLRHFSLANIALRYCSSDAYERHSDSRIATVVRPIPTSKTQYVSKYTTQGFLLYANTATSAMQFQTVDSIL